LWGGGGDNNSASAFWNPATSAGIWGEPKPKGRRKKSEEKTLGGTIANRTLRLFLTPTKKKGKK